jgi:hypothetical protein
MSDVRGKLTLGKAEPGKEQLTIELNGKVSPQKRAEFTEKLKALIREYSGAAEYKVEGTKKKY